MIRRTPWSRSLPLLLAAATAACDSTSLPPADELLFLRQSAGAPALVTYDTSFVVTHGDNLEVRMPYVNGRECLRFKIAGDGLAARPDGTPFREGDTVTVRIRLADPRSYNFEFQPAGLRFSADHPAELRVSYAYADPDIDGDGRVDERDRRRLENAAFWRQETAADPWVRIGTVRIDALEEMRADLNGFTRYALASN